VLDSFGDRSQSEPVGERDRATDDRLAATAVPDQGGHEAAVDLQSDDRELKQRGQG
jgi:hypothetical protein